MAIRVPRQWLTYKYYDPRGVLIQLREVSRRQGFSDLPEKVQRLRTRELRKFHESRQAAIFCYGLSQAVVGTTVRLAPVESDDYDCIAHREVNGVSVFTPVQIKELAPPDLNPAATIDGELKKLTKYASSSDLVIAMHINRPIFLDFAKLHIPQLSVGQLWFFGALQPNQEEWVLFGDALHGGRSYSFRYPT